MARYSKGFWRYWLLASFPLIKKERRLGIVEHASVSEDERLLLRAWVYLRCHDVRSARPLLKRSLSSHEPAVREGAKDVLRRLEAKT